MSPLTKIMLIALIGVAAATAARAEGDAKAGKKVFNKCKACHVLDKEQNRVGPHLVGIFGRTAGAVAGFGYSDVMASSGIVWDDASMAAYLADPKGFMPDNKMAFPGLKKDDDIADVIAYMKENS